MLRRQDIVCHEGKSQYQHATLHHNLNIRHNGHILHGLKIDIP